MLEIKAILIDDEKSARNVLTNLLSRTSINIKIVATCVNLEDGVEQIKLLKPDIVFLDVQMPNYAGYEIGSFFNKIDFEIIFVTAYDQYAIKAFELNAIDYLVKPIDRTKLARTLDKLKNKLGQQKTLVDYQVLLKTIKDKNYKKLVLPEVGNRRIINFDAIVAIEADGAYSIIHLKGVKSITTSKNLKYFEDILSDETCFFRSHRGWIINLNQVELLNKKAQEVILANNTVIAKISRMRLDGFENRIKL